MSQEGGDRSDSRGDKQTTETGMGGAPGVFRSKDGIHLFLRLSVRPDGENWRMKSKAMRWAAVRDLPLLLALKGDWMLMRGGAYW